MLFHRCQADGVTKEEGYAFDPVELPLELGSDHIRQGERDREESRGFS